MDLIGMARVCVKIMHFIFTLIILLKDDLAG